MRSGISPSKVYALLKRYYDDGWTQILDKYVQARSHVINLHWGDVAFDEDCEDTTLENEGDYIKKHLFAKFMEYLSKTLEDLNGDESGKKWVPLAIEKKRNILKDKQDGRFPGDVLCSKCDVSHEAEEFFCSLLD